MDKYHSCCSFGEMNRTACSGDFLLPAGRGELEDVAQSCPAIDHTFVGDEVETSSIDSTPVLPANEAKSTYRTPKPTIPRVQTHPPSHLNVQYAPLNGAHMD